MRTEKGRRKGCVFPFLIFLLSMLLIFLFSFVSSYFFSLVLYSAGIVFSFILYSVSPLYLFSPSTLSPLPSPFLPFTYSFSPALPFPSSLPLLSHIPSPFPYFLPPFSLSLPILNPFSFFLLCLPFIFPPFPFPCSLEPRFRRQSSVIQALLFSTYSLCFFNSSSSSFSSLTDLCCLSFFTLSCLSVSFLSLPSSLYPSSASLLPFFLVPPHVTSPLFTFPHPFSPSFHSLPYMPFVHSLHLSTLPTSIPPRYSSSFPHVHISVNPSVSTEGVEGGRHHGVLV